MNVQPNNLGQRAPDPIELRVHRPQIPWVPHYLVVAGPAGAPLAELLLGAERIARTEALTHFGDAECFSLIVNAARTRRVPWPHVHILLAPSPAKKRRAMFWLALKHLTRPARWFAARRRRHGVTRPELAVEPAVELPIELPVELPTRLPLAARGETRRGGSRRIFRFWQGAETSLYWAYCKFWRRRQERKGRARRRVGFHHGLLGCAREEGTSRGEPAPLGLRRRGPLGLRLL